MKSKVKVEKKSFQLRKGNEAYGWRSYIPQMETVEPFWAHPLKYCPGPPLSFSL